MSRWSIDPEGAAAQVLAAAWPGLGLRGPVLFAGGRARELPAATGSGDDAIAPTVWHRRFDVTGAGAPEPPPGPFAAVVLRLPKSRAEQEMTFHQCLGVAAPDGRLIVYGGNDEGIRSAEKRLATLAPVTVLATKGHGRVLQLARADVSLPLKTRLAEWRIVGAGGPDGAPWVSYPGLFAGGAPDAGTALLLAELPAVSPGATVLDFGCGPGAIAAAIRRHSAAARITMLDNDSVALVAAAENVPGMETVQADRLAALKLRRFDLIVSNPPLHSGVAEDTTHVKRLIAETPAHLSPGGMFAFVVQRRIRVEPTLAATFADVTQMADDGRYTVWRAASPRAQDAAPMQGPAAGAGRRKNQSQ